jgi:UDP-glucose 4-epimerase
MPVNETIPAGPLSPYAAHKQAAEKHAADYNRMYTLETVCLRYFNVFGPRQDPSSPYSGVISIFLEQVNADRKPVIHGDGEQSRDFIYVADVVAANLAAAQQPGVSGQIFNIGTGRQTTINQLWKEIGKLTDSNQTPAYEPAREGDIRISVADTRLAAETLGFQAKTTLEEGLAETHRWYAQRA